MLYIIHYHSPFHFVRRLVGVNNVIVNVIVDDKVSFQTHLYQFYLTRSKIMVLIIINGWKKCPMINIVPHAKSVVK